MSLSGRFSGQLNSQRGFIGQSFSKPTRRIMTGNVTVRLESFLWDFTARVSWRAASAAGGI